ncbi:MAG: hypothetical protein JWO64_828 [Hyphomicrobiales bacterium]|jgi:hypothetical protein|nr:hypothetical protein [Hyphomicrobiales bacterium]
MTQKWVWTCLAAASLATAITLAPVGAQAQERGGAGASMGQRGGPGAGGRNFSGGPRGAVVRPGGGGAAPLTISRNRAYVTNGGYRYGGGYYGYNRGYYNDGGWFPGLLAAPFLMTGALLGAGLGYGYDYDYGYSPYGVGYYSPAYYGGEIGNFCATPQRVCQLYTPSEVGVGCSCRAPSGGRFRGSVVP